jgi:hypothetical protein
VGVALLVVIRDRRTSAAPEGVRSGMRSKSDGENAKFSGATCPSSRFNTFTRMLKLVTRSGKGSSRLAFATRNNVQNSLNTSDPSPSTGRVHSLEKNSCMFNQAV